MKNLSDQIMDCIDVTSGTRIGTTIDIPKIVEICMAYEQTIDILTGAVKAKNEALQWYMYEAIALTHNVAHFEETRDPQRIMASLTVLGLDGGRRAANAINTCLIEGETPVKPPETPLQ